jgi:hypothetical protein
VYDPAGKNPLYNVAVYVPATPLQPLPKGVPTGADACRCEALFKSGALASAMTHVDGSFTLTGVPAGKDVPLVLQIGKWRRSIHIPVKACSANALANGSLTLPASVAPGDTDDNMPDIAVSTGSADTLECLMRRIGLPESEFVPGTSTAGHLHVFSGGLVFQFAQMQIPIGQEVHPMPGAPTSSTALWASAGQLMPFDITLLSCEGMETYNANPAALESYLNAGGRVFASHYHYAWFSGPIDGTSGNPYVPPADWGPRLATWSSDPGNGPNVMGGIVQTTLNGSTMPFPKGVAMQQWLMGVGALGTNGVPPTELAVYQPRFNASVGATNPASQSWISADKKVTPTPSMYFSFDTPVGARSADGGAPAYCGRAVFSDLHVNGNPMTTDSCNDTLGGGQPPPQGCADVDLSPQEKALEFMLFDLSSCVIPDTIEPPPVVPPLPQ